MCQTPSKTHRLCISRQTDKPTDARNRIWCILALKCDIWWYIIFIIFSIINWSNFMYLLVYSGFVSPSSLNFYKASRFVHPWEDALNRHYGQTNNQTNRRVSLSVSLSVHLCLRWTLTVKRVAVKEKVKIFPSHFGHKVALISDSRPAASHQLKL